MSEQNALVKAKHRESGTPCMIPAVDTPEFPHADYDIEAAEAVEASAEPAVAGTVEVDSDDNGN